MRSAAGFETPNHGAVYEDDAVGEAGREFVMAGHLGALIPGWTPTCLFWQRAAGGDEGIATWPTECPSGSEAKQT